MNNIALFYSNLLRYQEAMYLYKQMLELQKRKFGNEHPDTFWSMHKIAVSYSNLGQYQEAMDLHK